MHYSIHYSCISHIGNVRKVNQDNFICDSHYIGTTGTIIEFPLQGSKSSKDVPIFGVFDGMGGEECGEIASYIAAKVASTIKIKKDSVGELLQFCKKANSDICDYAKENVISAMGTTAAMLVFTKDRVTLCNIGDSKIFRFSDGILEQISEDHVGIASFGTKPPLSQNLGIPPNELVIAPYFAQGPYLNGDIYLICSDGLTDMVSVEEIASVLTAEPIEVANIELLEKALFKGGRDNITIILCQIERKLRWFSNKNTNFTRKGCENGN